MEASSLLLRKLQKVCTDIKQQDLECTDNDNWDCSDKGRDEKGGEDKGGEDKGGKDKGGKDKGGEDGKDIRHKDCYCTDPSGCPIIDLAIQQIAGTDFTIFCNKSVPSVPHKSTSTPTARECTSLCAASKDCWGSSWLKGTCQLFDELTGPHPTSLDVTAGSVAFMRGNATYLGSTQKSGKKEPDVVRL